MMNACYDASELVESLVNVINREVGAKKSLDANLSGAFKRAVQLACDERRTGVDLLIC